MCAKALILILELSLYKIENLFKNKIGRQEKSLRYLLNKV